MIPLILHLIVPMFFYTGVSSLLFLNFKLSALTSAALSSILCTPFLYLLYRRDQRERSKPTISRKLYGSLWYILLFGAALCVFGNEIVAITRLDYLSPAYEEAKKAIYTPPVLMQIGAAGILIPIAEEFIFRGLCFAALRDRLSFLKSALISAALFGIYHGNLPQGVYAFIIGIALAWLYEVSHTLLAPILLHISANLLSLLITNTAMGTLLVGRENGTAMAVTAILSFLVSIFSAMQIYRKNQLKEDLV